jgi:hypothetical protein
MGGAAKNETIAQVFDALQAGFGEILSDTSANTTDPMLSL